jgi:lipoprotein-anchoring transpeptidase ErfK/SrfK
MYYPSYFSGGYAIHGAAFVPAAPVSHGCIRIPMGAAIGFYQRNPVGTPVFVVR